MSNLVLEKNDDSQQTDIHQVVHDASNQSHLEHAWHKNPYYSEDDDAAKDVGGAGLLHEFPNVVEQQSDKENVDDVFNSEWENENLLNGFSI